ncbi:hypothetical protein FE257_008536 [Aspergillus nanangensis]|uniref:Uncharacterized protein n=1 Tax=Aspergillus nanangensis TaxID=2582783 RepID=A0AAD4CLA0_ASPNN|nr:hypothetical protein FE257_008536 [Aspergillus nanangensis]
MDANGVNGDGSNVTKRARHALIASHEAQPVNTPTTPFFDNPRGIALGIRKLKILKATEKLHHLQPGEEVLDFSPALSDTFQVYVVEEALTYPWLMDSLLALTSLHIASELVSDNDTYGGHVALAAEYASDALSYQNKAVPSFREALADISESNCDALFACSLILMASAGVSPLLQAKFEDMEGADGKSGGIHRTQALMSLFHFVKGIHSVIDGAHPWLANGPFKNAIWTHSDDAWMSSPPESHPVTRRLKRLCEQVESQTGSVYDRAIRLLAACFLKDEMMTIPWLVVAGQGFVNEVEKQDHMALLILMHWGVLLNQMDSLWWARLSGRKIVMDLVMDIAEHKEWDEVIGWATESVGLSID